MGRNGLFSRLAKDDLVESRSGDRVASRVKTPRRETKAAPLAATPTLRLAVTFIIVVPAIGSQAHMR